MSIRYILSVILITIVMVAGIYAYVNYLADVNFSPIQEKIGTEAPPGEQEGLGTERTEVEKIGILKELTKPEATTTTQKQKTSTATNTTTTTTPDEQVIKERTSILQNLAPTNTTPLSNEDKLKILNSL